MSGLAPRDRVPQVPSNFPLQRTVARAARPRPVTADVMRRKDGR